MATTLLAANDGGHIKQLRTLVDRFGLDGGRVWVTVATAQTTSMLAGEVVEWVDPAPTRDWRVATHNVRAIAPLFKRYSITSVISTGSSLAVSALPQARVRGIAADYIESVTRTDGISVSGRIVSCVPGVRLYVQWSHLATRRWRYRGSVLDGFTADAHEPSPVQRMVVSLGTSSTFGFRRLVERLATIVPTSVDVLWQTGCTDVSGLGVAGRTDVPAVELSNAIAAADVVVAHAGAGIAITALEAGKIPILVPRSAQRHEHIDDHQEQIAGLLAERQLAIVSGVDELDWPLVMSATAKRAARPPVLAPFGLDG